MAARDYHRDDFIFKTISALRIVVGVAVTLAVLFAMVWLIDYSSDRPVSSYNKHTVLLPDNGEDQHVQRAGTFFEGLLNKKAKQDKPTANALENSPGSKPVTPVPQHVSREKKTQSPPVVTAPSAQPPATKPQPLQSTTRPAKLPSVAAGVFTVQLGSFRQAERARIFSEDLAARGYQPYIMKSATPDGTLIYRVRAGRFATREEAMGLAARIEHTEKISVFVTSQ